MKESPIKTERKTLHLPEDTIRALNKLAARNGTDFSKEVRRAIDEYLDLETTAENIDMISRSCGSRKWSLTLIWSSASRKKWRLEDSKNEQQEKSDHRYRPFPDV